MRKNQSYHHEEHDIMCAYDAIQIKQDICVHTDIILDGVTMVDKQPTGKTKLLPKGRGGGGGGGGETVFSAPKR